MGNSITYPDGTVLQSTALTLAQINAIMQPLTLQMLGFPSDPASGLVRVEWPSEGAPFAAKNQDVCYLGCVLKDDPYNRIRDRSNSAATNPEATYLTETWTFTRTWEIRWVLYGPDSLDYSRALRSALYQDYFTNILSNNQLFPVSDFPEPIRAPELVNKQWFERVDFSVEMYEAVTETINRQTALSTEVIVEVPAGEIADITIGA